MSMNWLEGMNDHADGSGQPHPMAMPVFAGQKLVVVGGSSGMGRQTAADVVAAGGSAVIIGQDQARVDNTVQTLAKDGPAYGIAADLADRMQAERVCQQLADEHRPTAGSPAPSGTSTAASWPDATNHPPVRRPGARATPGLRPGRTAGHTDPGRTR